MNLSEFSDDRKPSNANMKIGFIDAEGQGDKDTTYDANLVCPILLASKCVIFNWKDSLQKDRILQLLGVMHKAAINVAEEGEIEVSGGAEKVFGHLHVVFRDWQYIGSTPESVKADLFKEERSADTDARLRNAIRNDIKNSFESITVWLFPPPVASSAKLTNKLRVDELSDSFKSQLQALRASLGTQLSHPMRFAGRPFTAKTLGPLVTQIACALNSGEVVRPMSAYLNMLKDEVDKQRTQAEDILKSITNKYLAKIEISAQNSSTKDFVFPSERQILSEFTKEAEAMLELFDNETADALDAMGVDLANTIRKDTNTSFAYLRQTGVDKLKAAFASLSRTFVVRLKQEVEASLESRVKSIEDHQLPMEEKALVEQLQKVFETSTASLHRLELEKSYLEEVMGSATKFFNLRADVCTKQNKLLLQSSVSLAEDCKKTAINNMRSFYEKKSTAYYAKPKGFQLKDLLLELNQKYAEIEKSLRSDIGKSKGSSKALLDKCVLDLKEYCEGLSKDMDRRYRDHLETMHSNILERGKAALTTKINSLANINSLSEEADRLLNVQFNASMDEIQDWSHTQYFTYSHDLLYLINTFVGPLRTSS